MKLRLKFLLLFSALCFFARSQSSIEVVTKLTLKGSQVKDYKATVYKGKIADTITVVNSKPQFIMLEPEQNYTIFFVKDTFDAECILVDTHIPADLKPKKYRVYVNVEIDPVHSKQKDAGEDFPSAIINDNKKSKSFEYHKQYHKQVHK